jgi:hypothetical protein
MSTPTTLPTTAFVRIPKRLYVYKFKNKHNFYQGFDSYSTKTVIVPKENQFVVNQIKTSLAKLKKPKKLKATTPKNCIELENTIFSNVLFLGVRQPYMNACTFYVELVDHNLIIPVSNSFLSYSISNDLLVGNKFLGEYRFVKLGSKNVELININSPIYKTALGIEEKFLAKKLQTQKFEFEVGSCYENPSGNVGMFLGYMSTVHMEPILQGKDKNNPIVKQSHKSVITEIYNSTIYTQNLSNINVFSSEEEGNLLGVPFPFNLDYRVETKVKDYLGLWLNIGNKNGAVVQNVQNMNQQEFENYIHTQVSFLKNYQVTYSNFELKKRNTYINKADVKKFEIPNNFIRDMKNASKEGLSAILNRDFFSKVNFFYFKMCSAYAPFINMNYLGFSKTNDPYFDYLEKYIQN